MKRAANLTSAQLRTVMEFDVFLSYSSKDKPVADAACHALESAGIRCWIAPRDIIPGVEWGASIVKAIANAKAMVLIFSSSANQSRQVTREVERAVNKGIPIVPVRIADIMPTDSLEYFLSTPHWLDAFPPPLGEYFHQLTQAVSLLIGKQPSSASPAMSASPDRSKPAAIVTQRPAAAPPRRPALVTGPELQGLCRDAAVLVKLNEALKQRGYKGISITAKDCTFGHSQDGDYCTVQWTGPTYDMDFNYDVRRDKDGVEVEILDCTRIP
jgi:hypothetical protein